MLREHHETHKPQPSRAAFHPGHQGQLEVGNRTADMYEIRQFFKPSNAAIVAFRLHNTPLGDASGSMCI
jgi:hypothetical protein